MRKFHATAVTTIAAVTGFSAFAADLPAAGPPVISRPSSPWNGFYAGLNSGYNFGTNGNVLSQNLADAWRDPFTGDALVPGIAALSMGVQAPNTQSGFIGGGQIGYNYHYAPNIVLGVEVDLQGAGVRGASSGGGAAADGLSHPDALNTNSVGGSAIEAGVDWLGSVRGRAGYLISPTLLVFGTGGFAFGGGYARVSQTALENVALQSVTGQQTYLGTNVWVGEGNQTRSLTGWTAGGGVEWMFTPNWSLKAEALYWDMGRKNVQTVASGAGLATLGGKNLVSGQAGVNFSGVIARAGVNYHFDWDAGPDGVSSRPSGSLQKAPPVAAPTPVWKGFYAGLNSGYNFGVNSNVGAQSAAPPWLSNSGDPRYPNVSPERIAGFGVAATNAWAPNTQSGAIGGAQLGYNYQYDSNALIGVEADIQGSGVRGLLQTLGVSAGSLQYRNAGVTTNYGTIGSAVGRSIVRAGVDWLGTVRGRVGFLWSPSLLFYGTGGLAYGGAHAQVAQSAVENNSLTYFPDGAPLVPPPPAEVGYLGTNNWIGRGRRNQLMTGWTGGGGVEWRFASQWSLKAEALYWDLGRMNVQTTAFGVSGSNRTGNVANNMGWGNASVNYSGVIARAGINYHFDWAGKQIVASY